MLTKGSQIERSPQRGGPVIRETPTGTEIDIRLIPRAGTTAITGVRDGAFLIRVSAAPVEGAANDALLRLLASQLDVPVRSLRIVAGARGRRKRVAIAGLTAAFVRERLTRQA
jgi:uncharacterized protein YggU (UPF0235/DUF167 family)